MNRIASRVFNLFLAGIVCCGCTTSIPRAGTRSYVNDTLNSLQIGNTPAQVVYLMNGEPVYVTSVRLNRDVYEVWEYRVGNFMHERPAMIIFQNKRVVAVPQNSQELLAYFYSLGVIPDAQFWTNQDSR